MKINPMKLDSMTVLWLMDRGNEATKAQHSQRFGRIPRQDREESLKRMERKGWITMSEDIRISTRGPNPMVIKLTKEWTDA